MSARHDGEPSDPLDAGAAAPEPRPARWRPAAWRRPGMVVFYGAYRAVAALGIATPLAVLVGSAVEGYPGGDAVLLEPGGLMLTELVRLSRSIAPALAAQITLGTALAAALGLLPLAALIVALGRPGPLSLALLGGRTARAIGPLTLLWGLAAVAQIAVAGLLVLLGAKLVAPLALGDRAHDLAGVGVAAAALLAAGAVSVVHDLARVSAVHEERGVCAAASRALSVVRAAPLSAAWACASRAVLGLAALAGAAWLDARLGLSNGGRVTLAFALHHAALGAAACLRASWLAAAIRLLERGKGGG